MHALNEVDEGSKGAVSCVSTFAPNRLSRLHVPRRLSIYLHGTRSSLSPMLPLKQPAHSSPDVDSSRRLALVAPATRNVCEMVLAAAQRTLTRASRYTTLPAVTNQDSGPAPNEAAVAWSFG
jgi:hypothetical protein